MGTEDQGKRYSQVRQKSRKIGKKVNIEEVNTKIHRKRAEGGGRKKRVKNRQQIGQLSKSRGDQPLQPSSELSPAYHPAITHCAAN